MPLKKISNKYMIINIGLKDKAYIIKLPAYMMASQFKYFNGKN